MNTRVLFASVLVGAAVLACTEGTAPLNDAPAQPDAGFHFLTWDTSKGPVTFSATGETPGGALDIVDRPLRAAGDSMLLDRFEASFYAVRGQTRSVQINYLEEAGSNAIAGPYVKLRVSDPVQRPDGSPIAVGDSVLITLSVDPTELVIHLEPSGLQFGNATGLRMWYGGANHDFNADGVVDSQDSYIQQHLLGMAWTEGGDNPWGVISAEHSLSYERFTAYLQHFSGYAISW